MADDMRCEQLKLIAKTVGRSKNHPDHETRSRDYDIHTYPTTKT